MQKDIMKEIYKERSVNLFTFLQNLWAIKSNELFDYLNKIEYPTTIRDFYTDDFGDDIFINIKNYYLINLCDFETFKRDTDLPLFKFWDYALFVWIPETNGVYGYVYNY